MRQLWLLLWPERAVPVENVGCDPHYSVNFLTNGSVWNVRSEHKMNTWNYFWIHESKIILYTAYCLGS